jgi:Fe-S cluster assembly iron-binding protein IscA
MKVEINQETIDEIKKIIDTQSDRPANVRIFVAGVGCSGPSLGLALDDIKDSDLIDESGEVKFIMDKDVYEQMGEIKVEFVGNGYYVAPINQVESGCSGCGGGCH